MSKPQAVLVSQQQALWDYLDALLQEIPEEQPEAAVQAAPVAAVVEPEIQEWDPQLLSASECLPEPVDPVQPVRLEAAADRVEPPIVHAETAPEARPEPALPAEDPTAPPEWARSGFQALLFKVNGLTLAVPLIKLHSVIPWPEQGLTAMPNQPAWCFGLLRYRDQNVRVVDTATMVIPDDKRAAMEAAEPRHLLIVGDGRWGLACSAVGDVVKLGPQEVKWRSRGGRRPWLAGTVLGHLCALMDTEAFAEMLAERR